MKKIYIVEDELLIALVYEHFFTKKGYEIKGPFTNNKEAMENFSVEDCLIVLLDVQLEGSSTGIEVAENIRKLSNVPIVFTTGNDAKKTKERCAHLENIHIVPKPVDFTKIINILDTL